MIYKNNRLTQVELKKICLTFLFQFEIKILKNLIFTMFLERAKN